MLYPTQCDDFEFFETFNAQPPEAEISCNKCAIVTYDSGKNNPKYLKTIIYKLHKSN